jgi:hypothetical protein
LPIFDGATGVLARRFSSFIKSGMQVDFSVELGRDDETLEIPWSSEDGRLRYRDLKKEPAAIAYIEEAKQYLELRDFLVAVNAPVSVLATAKCDVWSTTEINPEEEIFNSPYKFASYVDLLFSDHASRTSFDAYEKLLKELTRLLQRVPEIPASAEFLLRRCFDRQDGSVQEGFYITFYLFGYGRDEAKSRAQWAVGLQLVSAALAQLSSRNSTL